MIDNRDNDQDSVIQHDEDNDALLTMMDTKSADLITRMDKANEKAGTSRYFICPLSMASGSPSLCVGRDRCFYCPGAFLTPSNSITNEQIELMDSIHEILSTMANSIFWMKVSAEKIAGHQYTMGDELSNIAQELARDVDE